MPQLERRQFGILTGLVIGGLGLMALWLLSESPREGHPERVESPPASVAGAAAPLPEPDSVCTPAEDESSRGLVILCRVFRLGDTVPVEGAEVRVDWRESDGRRPARLDTTDAEGRCRLFGLPAETVLRVQARSGRAVSESTRVRFALDENEKRIRLELRDGGEITGMILRQDGDPVDAPRVVVFRPEPAAGNALVEIEDGRFRIIGLASCAFDLRFSGAACGTVVKRSIPSGTRDLNVILPPPGRIRGVVTERKSGRPLPGLAVVRGGSGLRELSRTTSDEAGAFGFDGLGPGRHVLWLGQEGADGYRVDYVVVDLPEGETETVELLADEGLGVNVRVHLVGPDAESLDDSFGLILSQKPVDDQGVVRSYRRWQAEASSGQVVRSPAIFAPGRLEVAYLGAGRRGSTRLGRVDVSSDADQVYEFTVRLHSVLRGVIVDGDDQIVREDGYVVAAPVAGGGGSARHDRIVDGEFHLVDLHASLYRVFASLGDGRITSMPEVEVGAGDKVLRLPLAEADGVLTGRLTDEAGWPVARAWVTISSSSGRTFSVRSDCDGWWRAEGVANGRLTVSISPQVAGYEPVEFETVKTPGHCRLNPVVLSRRRWITGEVVDSAGRPRLARIFADDRFMGASWIDGTFRVVIPRDTEILSAVVQSPDGDRVLGSGSTRVHPADQDARIVVESAAAGTDRAAAVAELQATVRGRVTEEGTGLPVADVPVVLIRERKLVALGRLDGEGRFALRGPAGSDYQIRVYSSAWARTPSEPFELRAAGEEQIDLVVGRGRIFRGCLVNTDGKPIEGALVHTGAGLEKTDRQGRLVVPGASPNDRLVVRCGGYQDTVLAIDPSDFACVREVTMLRIGQR